MKDLYKGRYLIAVYDKEERCLGVASSIKELKEMKNLLNPYGMFSKMLNGKYKYLFHQYHLIDCLEKHDDVFQEEDELFLKECPDVITDKLRAEALGLSLRNYYRKKASMKTKEREL